MNILPFKPASSSFSLEGKSVFVAGHRGMVGRALVKRLAKMDCTVLTVDRQSVDLRDQLLTREWFNSHRPDVVFMAAARVGGIRANAVSPATFLYDNLSIELNVIDAAYRSNVEKLLFLGSSCIYPKFAHQPIQEDELLTGSLEPTNEAYAIAKIAGVKMCDAYKRQYGCNFISAMPTNLYGPNDNFDLVTSHVLPALLMKIHTAKTKGSESVSIWGSGRPRREFMYVDDLADACIFLMERYEAEGHVNVGTGLDISIVELAQTIADIVGWRGTFVFNPSEPDGTPRKLLDVSKLMGMGWSARTSLEDGIQQTYQWMQCQVMA